jgi:Histidine kinase-, DNA gyrase B-, and HSP90-like ATPase
MTPEEQIHLFARFSQATPRTHVEYGGSGLGLFISKSLTDLQCGFVGVSSVVNVGSIFAFSVLTRIASPSKAAPVRDSTMWLELKSIEEAVKAAHYTILLVEDNVINVSDFTSLLMPEFHC